MLYFYEMHQPNPDIFVYFHEISTCLLGNTKTLKKKNAFLLNIKFTSEYGTDNSAIKAMTNIKVSRFFIIL